MITHRYTISIGSDHNYRVSLPYTEPKTLDGIGIERYTTVNVPVCDVIEAIRAGIGEEANKILSKYF